MKITDLRILNYVMYHDDIVQIDAIDSDGSVLTVGNINGYKDCGFDGNIDSLKPILITEEILLKCSFEIYANMNDEYLKNGLLFFFGKGLICKIGEYGDLRISIKYLHQLQNVYYFLMGKELIVKL